MFGIILLSKTCICLKIQISSCGLFDAGSCGLPRNENAPFLIFQARTLIHIPSNP